MENQFRKELTEKFKIIQEKMEKVHFIQENEEEYKQILSEFLSLNEVNKPMLARLIEKIEIFEDKRIVIHYKFVNLILV